MKKIKYIILLFLLCLIPTFKVDAASANISVTSSKSQVIVGETVTVTVKVSSSAALGSWSFDVSHSSNLTLTNSSFGGLYIVDFVGNSNTKSKTYTFTFKAKSSGSATVSIKNSSVIGYDESKMSVTNGSKTFKLMTYAELQATYSKNNYLKSLSVDGYDITPVFNKETLEYNLELENGIESALIKASKEDSTATVKGTGEVSLKEGVNTFEIVVTAQNGSKRTYTLNITVKELDPIEVVVNGANYTVIRKKELMPKSNMYFQESTVTINEEQVPAYYNEVSNITLVGLANGLESKLFIYDNGQYKKYEELSFNQLFIQVLDMDENLLGEGYAISKINVGDSSLAVYTKEGQNYPVIYGLNIETGKKNLYTYDSDENTLQRYETVEVENNEELYFIIIIGLFGFIVISYILFIVLLMKKNKRKKKQIEKVEEELEKTKVLKEISEIKEDKKKKNSKNDVNPKR